MARTIRRLGAVGVAALLMAGCGVGNDDSPRDIPVGDQQSLGGNTDRNVGAARGPARAQRTPTLTAASISLSSPISTCLRPCTTHPHSQPPNTPWLLFWAPNLRPLAHRDGRRGPRRANYVLHEHCQGGERLAP